MSFLRLPTLKLTCTVARHQYFTRRSRDHSYVIGGTWKCTLRFVCSGYLSAACTLATARMNLENVQSPKTPYSSDDTAFLMLVHVFLAKPPSLGIGEGPEHNATKLQPPRTLLDLNFPPPRRYHRTATFKTVDDIGDIVETR